MNYENDQEELFKRLVTHRDIHLSNVSVCQDFPFR